MQSLVLIIVVHILASLSANCKFFWTYLAYPQDGNLLIETVNLYTGSSISTSIVKHRMKLLLHVGEDFRPRLKNGQDISIRLSQHTGQLGQNAGPLSFRRSHMWCSHKC